MKITIFQRLFFLFCLKQALFIRGMSVFFFSSIVKNVVMLRKQLKLVETKQHKKDTKMYWIFRKIMSDFEIKFYS